MLVILTRRHLPYELLSEFNRHQGLREYPGKYSTLVG